MRRKALITLLKLLFVSAAVFWLGKSIDFTSVARVLSQANLWLLALAFGLGLFPVMISGFRWRTLLGTLGIEIPILDLACVAQIGQFFAVLVPGVMGDDGARFFYISKLAPTSVRRAISTVLLDRTLGFSSLFVLTSVCIPLNWAVLTQQKTTHWIAVCLLGASGCILAGGAVFFSLKQALLENLFSFLHNKFSHSAFIHELIGAASDFASKRRSLALVGAAALVTQTLICTIYWVAGQSIGIHVSLLSWMCFVPVIVLAGVLPITFAGIGVRDYLLFIFLSASATTGTAIEKERIAALSLILLVLALQGAALGGLIYLGYKPSRKNPNPDLSPNLAPSAKTTEA